MAKNSAPKGKGTVKPRRRNKPKPAKLVRDPKKQLITIESALQYLQSQGIQITEKNVDDLAAIATIKTDYIGSPDDKNRHLKRLMLQALEKSYTIVSDAAPIVGIHRQTHYAWMLEDEEYKEAVHALADVALDFAESCLFKNMKDGREASNIFFLKTKGKKRGYIESVHNINQNFEDNNVHQYEIPKNDRDQFEEAQVVK